jgi:hypothetical protein
MILNINYSQIVELTDTFRSRSMCSIFQKQIKKLTIHGYVEQNEKFMETFSNLKILLFDYKNEDQLYLILPKLFNMMTKLTLIQLYGMKELQDTFQENFRIWLTQNTSMTNTRNTVIGIPSNTITIWNGQEIDPKLFLSSTPLSYVFPGDVDYS